MCCALDNPGKLVSALRSISPLADFSSFAPRAWRRAAHGVGQVWLAGSVWWAAGGSLFSADGLVRQLAPMPPQPLSTQPATVDHHLGSWR